MGLLTFKGGVHPNDGKSLAKDKEIVELLPKGDLVYPLSQHIGAPASPIVKKGDHVLKGQMIAEAGGFVSAPIYASVSGTVKAIEPHVNPTGAKVNCIVIENDGQYEEVEYPPVKPLSELTKEEILNMIANAGIVGMGGAGFPTRVKLSPKEPDKIDYIIANCAECEPYITADYRRMMETPELLVEGMKVILKLFDNAKGIFGVEDNKPDCIAKLKELVKDEPRMEVKTLMTKYPQGAERQLIYATTGRAINSTMLPADAIIALPSSGVHSNGFSLVRHVFGMNTNPDVIRTHVESLGMTLGEALLEPTKIYVKSILSLAEQVGVKGCAHITGGGFYENIPRCLKKGMGAKISRDSLRILPLFELIQRTGNIPERDMFNTFNMGVGMCVVVAREDADRAVEILKASGEDAYIMGEVVSGEGVTIC